MRTSLPTINFYGEPVARRSVAGLTLAESYYAAGLRLPRHSHQCATFCLVLQGAFAQVYPQESWECRPATLLFCQPDEAHADYFNHSDARCFIIECAPEWLARARDSGLTLDGPARFQGGWPAWLTARLYQEFQQTDAPAALAIEGLALELIAAVARSAPPEAERQAPRWLKVAQDLLRARFADNLTLAEVAATVDVHPVHLAKVFRRFQRCTVGEYVRRLRIEFACQQLSATDARLVDISLAAGFAHQAHFSRAFKQHTGLTPATYRTIFRAG
jgi:AraC family transcriptional regulator